MIDVQHVEQDGRGAFFVAKEGVHLADMTYTRVDPVNVIIDHTEVDPQLKGMGVGRKLLDAAVAWARANAMKITATCAYAKGQFDKDESIRDVLA